MRSCKHLRDKSVILKIFVQKQVQAKHEYVLNWTHRLIKAVNHARVNMIQTGLMLPSMVQYNILRQCWNFPVNMLHNKYFFNSNFDVQSALTLVYFEVIYCNFKLSLNLHVQYWKGRVINSFHF